MEGAVRSGYLAAEAIATRVKMNSAKNGRFRYPGSAGTMAGAVLDLICCQSKWL